MVGSVEKPFRKKKNDFSQTKMGSISSRPEVKWQTFQTKRTA